MEQNLIKFKPNNVLSQRYVTSEVDAVWTLDFTCIPTKKRNIWVFVVLDLASRRALFHRAHISSKTKTSSNTCDFTSLDVIADIDSCIHHYQKPKCIHTDMGGQFVSREFSDFVAKMGIVHSTGDPLKQKFSNQAHESFNRTFKQCLRRILQENFNFTQVPKSFNALDTISQDQSILDFINAAINQYNNKSHKSLFEASPNIAESALVLNSNSTTDDLFELAAKQSSFGDDLELIKAEIIQKYAGNWLDFFVSWRIKMEENHQQVLLEQQSSADRIISAQASQIKSLGFTIDELRSQLSYLLAREEKRELDEKLALERREINKNRTRRPPRDAITWTELETVYHIIDNSNAAPFQRKRDKLAMLLLYLFGLRVSNLRVLTFLQIRQLLEEDRVSINLPIIKSKDIAFREFPIPSSARHLIRQLSDEIQAVLNEDLNKGKDSDFVFTREGQQAPLSRQYLTERTNFILKEASRQCGKTLTSHSFRIGLITSIIEVDSLESANQVIGHANLSTTLLYSRRRFNEKQLRNIIEKAEEFRQAKRIPKLYKKRNPKTKT